MKPPLLAVVAALSLSVAAVSLADGAAPTTRPTTAPAALATGKITGISKDFGNAYTSIKADRYEALGLVEGRTILVTMGETSVEMPLAKKFFDVDPRQPVAVLHEEGLTLAICDGNFSEVYDVKKDQAFELALVAAE